MLQIGPHSLPNPVILAPMAGVTDAPYRELCLELGAAMAVAEMQSADKTLRDSRKSTLRRARAEGETLRSVQLVGNDPIALAEAARFNADQGADIIDINMGCPAKKVCRKAAGSALLADEVLVGRILEAVVSAVDLPVTLKIRTGTTRDHRNGVQIASIAEQSGIQMLAVHGRTRADKFNGTAEYQTIASIVAATQIPVVANGDIDSPEKAASVMALTGAAGVMIGRSAQGRPWLPGQVARFLASGCAQADPTIEQQIAIIERHVTGLHNLYGATMGVRIARKHVGWFLEHTLGKQTPAYRTWKSRFNAIESCAVQFDCLHDLQATLSNPLPSPVSESHSDRLSHSLEHQHIDNCAA